MLRKNWVFWLNSTLLHGIVIVLLWFPQPLHFPTRADVMDAWKNAALYFERTLHPEQFARAEQEARQPQVRERHHLRVEIRQLRQRRPRHGDAGI